MMRDAVAAAGTGWKLLGVSILGGLVVVLGFGLLAQSHAPFFSGVAVSDDAWVVGSTVLTLAAIIPGIALLYGSLARAGNVASIFGQVLAIVAVSGIVWVAYGYSLSFDGGSNKFIGGLSRVFLTGVGAASKIGTIHEYTFIAFLMAFAWAAVAMIAGAFTERIRFPVLLLFTAAWVTFVFVPIVHWTWGVGGWFESMGVQDAAGGLAGFIAVGTSGLVGIFVIGSYQVAEHETMPKGAWKATALGASVVWLSWLGLIAGSDLAPSAVAVNSIPNLVVATAAAALSRLLAEWIVTRQASLFALTWGAITGLAAFAPAANRLGPMASIVLGVVAGLASLVVPITNKNIARREGSFDAFNAYFVGGAAGMLGAGLLATLGSGSPNGSTIAAGQITGQMFAVVSTLVWSGLVSFILFKLAAALGGLKFPEASGQI